MTFTVSYIHRLLSRADFYLSAVFCIGVVSQLVGFSSVSYAYTLQESLIALTPTIIIGFLSSIALTRVVVSVYHDTCQDRNMYIFLALERVGNKKHASRYALTRIAS